MKGSRREERGLSTTLSLSLWFCSRAFSALVYGGVVGGNNFLPLSMREREENLGEREKYPFSVGLAAAEAAGSLTPYYSSSSYLPKS